MQVWSILSIWKIVWWTVSRDIHSICIVSKHVLDAERMWEELLTISASHLWVTPCDFPTLLTLKLHTKYQIFNTLSVQKMGYCATKRDISIHCSWSDPKPSLDALSWWYLRASLCIFLPLMGLTKTCPTIPMFTLKMHTKCQILSTPSVQKIGWCSTMLYNERHTLLMKWFRTFLRCMRQIEGASLCILLPLMVLTQLYSTKADSQIAQNTRCWVRPLSTKIACCSERRDIHCLWSVSNQSWDAWAQWEGLLIASVYQLLVPLSHFLPRLALKLHAKYHILDTLSVHKMGCWTARRDIHCLWSASNPFLDALSRWEELPCASVRHLWASPSYVPRRCTLKLVTKCKFVVRGILSV